MITRNLDFSILISSTVSRKFFVLDELLTPYSMTGATVVLVAEAISGDVTIAGVLSGTDNTEVAFSFAPPFTNTAEQLSYEVIETDIAGDQNILYTGLITIRTSHGFTADLMALIANLKPPGITIAPDFQTQQIFYWRLYLQKLITPNISDGELELDSSWPPLVNFLIAHLVIHDFLQKYARKAYIEMLGGSTTSEESQGGGGIKKIETGPTSVEFYDTSSALTSIFKQGSQGDSPFDQMAKDICQLAARLRIYLPMCGQLAHSPFVPIKAGRLHRDNMIQILVDNYGQD